MSHYLYSGEHRTELASCREKPARTFGWTPEFHRADASASASLRFFFHRFAYKPILQCSGGAPQAHRRRPGERREDQSRTRHAPKPQRQEILYQANAQANKLIEEARAAAARVQEQETQKAIAAAEQIIAKAREAAAAGSCTAC